VFLGDPSRFTTGKQVASYIGMIPCEHSSGKRQRLGKMTKEGNSRLRYLWTEATLQFCFTPNVSAIMTGVAQVYVDGTSGQLATVAVSSTSASFPGGSWPLGYVVPDAIGRIVSVINARAAPFTDAALNLYNGPA
jgi:hypothetical protein